MFASVERKGRCHKISWLGCGNPCGVQIRGAKLDKCLKVDRLVESPERWRWSRFAVAGVILNGTGIQSGVRISRVLPAAGRSLPPPEKRLRSG